MGLYSPLLFVLNPRFAPDGFVHLQHCNIGQNRDLLSKLAKIWQVPVYAGTGTQNPVYRFNTGSYVRANPDGSFESHVGRPVYPALSQEEKERMLRESKFLREELYSRRPPY